MPSYKVERGGDGQQKMITSTSVQHDDGDEGSACRTFPLGRRCAPLNLLELDPANGKGKKYLKVKTGRVSRSTLIGV
jgi:hypothetical protein